LRRREGSNLNRAAKRRPGLHRASPTPKPNGFGLPLRAKRKTGSGCRLSEAIQMRRRLIQLPHSLASISPVNFAQSAKFLKLS